jgi:hypothetical protein
MECSNCGEFAVMFVDDEEWADDFKPPTEPDWEEELTEPDWDDECPLDDE